VGEGPVALIDELSMRVHGLDALRTAHVAYYGELLPHVLFGDIARWAQENVDSERVAVRETLNALETAWESSDDEVRNLIAVSFLDNLDQGSFVVDILPPELAVAYMQSD
jgi:hypothetical protein